MYNGNFHSYIFDSHLNIIINNNKYNTLYIISALFRLRMLLYKTRIYIDDVRIPKQFGILKRML